MSLSFVSSAVLSSTDGVSHNEEKSIESKEVQSLRTRNSHKPLFEQLRSNREEEQAKYDENTKAMMGMRTLDEEECAHLDAVEQQRKEQQDRVKEGVEQELAMFRAARADRRLVESAIEDEDAGDSKNNAAVAVEKQQAQTQEVSIRPKIVPKIIGKKRRKPQNETGGTKDKKKRDVASTTCASDLISSEGKQDTTTAATTTKKPIEKVSAGDSNKDDSGSDEEGGLGGLLGCYGSDDDSD